MEKTLQDNDKKVTSRGDEIACEPNGVVRLLKILGPGLVTGASDDDPAGIATYASAGARFGYGMLWTAWITFPLMAGIQYTCAKIALVTGRGLTTLIRENYSRPVLWTVVVLLVIANVINLGVDIGAVAAGVNLLTGWPITIVSIPIGIGLAIIQIWCSYRTIANVFKWLTLGLFAYIASAFFTSPDWAAVLKQTFIPTFEWSGEYLQMLVAIFGTTISPYLFFWQANHEVEEEKQCGRRHLWQRKGASDRDLSYAAVDVNVGMFLSNVVMYFIILTTAATLHRSGTLTVDTAAQAAEALRPVAGNGARVLMAVGLIGCGLLTIPVLAACNAYAVAEALQWKMGLNQKPERAKSFYWVIVISTLLGMTINFCGFNPIKALVWTSLINGYLAPPLLIIILMIANNSKIMKDRINGKGLNFLGWTTVVLMSAAAIASVLV